METDELGEIKQKRGFVERSNRTNRMRFNVPWGAEGMCEIHCGYKEAPCYLGEATWVVLRLPVWFDEVTLIEVYLFSLVVRLPVWCSNLFIVVRCDYLDWGLPV